MWQLLNEHVEVDREQIQEQEVESALLVELTSELQGILVRFSKMKEIIIGYDPHEEMPLHILEALDHPTSELVPEAESAKGRGGRAPRTADELLRQMSRSLEELANHPLLAQIQIHMGWRKRAVGWVQESGLTATTASILNSVLFTTYKHLGFVALARLGLGEPTTTNQSNHHHHTYSKLLEWVQIDGLDDAILYESVEHLKKVKVSPFILGASTG
jgi:hypothetical protein